MTRPDCSHKKIVKDLTNKDGWLTYAKAEGGKKRISLSIMTHKERMYNGEMAGETSAEAYGRFLADAANVSVVVADAPQVQGRYAENSEPYSCMLAAVCDAAGLIEKGRTIVAFSLEGYEFTRTKDGRGDFFMTQPDEVLYGFTAEGQAAAARELLETGAELVCAPVGWEAPKEPACHVVGWTAEDYAYDYALKLALPSSFHSFGERNVAILDADNETLRQAAAAFGGDGAERRRKSAVTFSKEVFSGLALEPAQAVDLLSYGMIEWEDTKSKSYKVPIWKKGLLRPTVSRFEGFVDDRKSQDDVASKLEACSLIWKAALDAYGVSLKLGSVGNDELVKVWKEVGQALGVDSGIEACLVAGVPVEDVLGDWAAMEQ